ncbi:MAG: DUF2786 domain-containing protein [Clostridia bacterium]|nr:DUF2786 domain-containing protein [Clostridia bacterium]MBQ6960904.1 DUF2786 domain-containing protein [Clostridia bacterium]
MNESIVEKIQKLLALAADAEDHEAKAALMKARDLMARYKLSEKDVQQKDAPRELHQVFTDQCFSGVKDNWKADLSRIIAENHCCVAISRHREGSTVCTVGFAGLDDDPYIVQDIFRYAVRHIKREEERQREAINRCLSDQRMRNDTMRVWASSYPPAFARGLRDQYKAQFKGQDGEESLALSLVIPKEVEDYLGTLKKNKIKFRFESPDAQYVRQGYNDGRTFKPTKSLPGQAGNHEQLTLADVM